jgi:hypothetical protein
VHIPTLISAPAGFGKTTLLAEWLAGVPAERSVAWLSLEESDRQPASYWTYLITALQRAVPGVGVPDPAPRLGAAGSWTGWWRRLLHRRQRSTPRPGAGGPPPAGVREPRRPAPTAGTGAATLPEPTAHS